MLELSRALATLHDIELEGKLWNVRGLHYDVKPANILLDQHLFVLADFDISKIIFPPYARQESLGNESWYQAPETKSPNGYGGQAGLESDAFSLGCVFLEVLVHMRGGAQAVGDFRYRRRPNQKKEYAPFLDDDHLKLSADVEKELNEIERDTKSVKRARYAEIVRKMLDVDMDNRLSAKDAEKQFRDIEAEEQLNKQPDHQELASEPNAGHPIKPAKLSHDAIGSHSSPSPGFSHCSREMNSTDVPTDARSVDKILSRFTDKCEYKNDCQSLLQTDLTIQQQGHTKNLWSKKRWIPSWAKTLTSSTLFLHGSSDEDGRLLSFISSQIVKSAGDLQPSPNMVVLQHFCGKNAKNGDEAVYIMMQSLIYQLLSDRSEVNGLNQRIDAISGRDLDALWESFASLIKELPSGKTVVCVIDGLQSYCRHSDHSREERAKEAEELLPKFIKMASVPGAVGPCFKLLLTASKRPIAARLSKKCDPDSGNLHGIPDDEIDLEGLSDSFWTRNKLEWK